MATRSVGAGSAGRAPLRVPTPALAVVRAGLPVRPRRRVVAAVASAVAFLAGGGYLGAGFLAWNTNMPVQPGCAMREFRDQTPADFLAYDGDHELEVDAAPYRFTDYEEVDFPSRGDGLAIGAWYAPGPDGVASPTVIVVHGKASCRRDPVVLLPAAMLHRAGFGVLLIDLRNHGGSASDNGRFAVGAKEYRDVLGAWDWLVARGHDPGRIGLFGSSLGSASAIIALGEEPRIAAAWEDAGPADSRVALVENAIARGYPGWVVDAAVPVARLFGEPELLTRTPLEAMSRLAGRPFAIVHGLADGTVLPHHALDLALAAASAGVAVEPWFVPDAQHSEAVLLVPDAYEARLVAFFRGAIGSPR